MTQRTARIEAPGKPVRLDEPVMGSDLKIRLTVEVETDGIPFRARLGFSDSGQLWLVELRPLDQFRGCTAASDALARTYGNPVSRRRSPGERTLWTDAESDNLIEFRRGADGACVVRMTPLPKRNPYLGG